MILTNHLINTGHKHVSVEPRCVQVIQYCIWPLSPQSRDSTQTHKSMIAAGGRGQIFPGDRHCEWRYALALRYRRRLQTAPTRVAVSCVARRASDCGTILFRSGAISSCCRRRSGFFTHLLHPTWHWFQGFPAGAGRHRLFIVCVQVRWRLLGLWPWPAPGHC